MAPTVWGITRVKDEADVLYFTLEHMATEGLDGIFIMDNASTDGTRDLIQRFRDEQDGPPLILVDEDLDVGYYQSIKMTEIAQRVTEQHGADWIVPFDADELWCSKDQPLGDYLRGLAVDCVRAQLFNHFPTSGDPESINPFWRIVNRDRNPAPLPKVALRWKSGVTIGMGNHSAEGIAAELVHSDLVVHHLPWRSADQFVSKITNGSAAYKATDLPEEVGAHWRSYGRILDANGPDAVREIYETWFHDPKEVELVADPAPYCRWA